MDRNTCTTQADFQSVNYMNLYYMKHTAHAAVKLRRLTMKVMHTVCSVCPQYVYVFLCVVVWSAFCVKLNNSVSQFVKKNTFFLCK